LEENARFKLIFDPKLGKYSASESGKKGDASHNTDN
jgi:hypothetical protein